MRLEPERRLVAEYSRRLRRDGLVVGTAGNVSARSGRYVAITPSGVDYDTLTPASVCIVDVDGLAVDAPLPPSTELPLHLAAYGATGANAVVHTHSPYATALAAVVDELPSVHYLVADLGGPVRVAGYATPGSDELAGAAAAALAGRTAALLRNHGAIVVADSLAEAYERAVTLEWLCAVYWRARQIGDPHVLDADEVERLVELVRRYTRSSGS